MQAHPFAISMAGLTKQFGRHRAVDTLNLTGHSGSVFGFLGPNGAGNTTTVSLLSVLIAPTGETAIVVGHPVGSGNQAIRRSVGILTETLGLYERLSAQTEPDLLCPPLRQSAPQLETPT